MIPICFIIQPFDSGEFGKRYNEIYKPAIEQAGLEPYRVDQDPNVDVPITAIEEGIAKSAICLADITTDNPNVWYELGFAFAVDRPVILICSDSRREKFPFDIQHRAIIQYGSESRSDFDRLGKQILERAKALLSKAILLRQAAETDRSFPTKGLSQQELIVLAVLAGETALPGTTVSMWNLARAVERAGLTPLAFGVAIRNLMKQEFVSTSMESDPNNYEDYMVAQIATSGWEWITENQQYFISHQTEAPSNSDLDDEIPF